MVRAAGIASSRGASSSRIVGDFPPSSSVTRFIVAAPSRIIPSPTATEPVKEILSTSGLRTSSAPTTLPRPVTTFMRPFGRSASWRASTKTRVCSELNSLGLITTVQPAAMAEASLRQMNNAFAFHAGDQTGNAYRLQRDRRFVPMARPRHFLNRLFSGEKRVDARFHDEFGEANNSAVFFDHRGSKIVESRRSGFMQPAQKLRAFF